MKAHLETIIAILNGIKPGADRNDIYYDVGRAIGEAKLALIELAVREPR